jgi:flagellar hook-basal body complex protein FliE
MDSLSAIQAVSPMSESLSMSSLDRATVLPPTPTQFVSMISDGMNIVNNNIASSESAMNAYALDGSIPTHEVMLTMEKAKFSLQVAVEVRNRLVEAYSELTRMQI